MKFWLVSRVQEAESTEAFQRAKERAAQRSLASTRGSEQAFENLKARIAQAEITVRHMPTHGAADLAMDAHGIRNDIAATDDQASLDYFPVQ